jgi:hypothetical protein
MKKLVLILCLNGTFMIQSNEQLLHEGQQQDKVVVLDEFDFSRFEFDETEELQSFLKEDAKPLSQLEIYARQIGVVLLFKYLDMKEYYSDWRDYLSQLIKGNFKIEWV